MTKVNGLPPCGGGGPFEEVNEKAEHMVGLLVDAALVNTSMASSNSTDGMRPPASELLDEKSKYESS